jgi:CheY-like chemotaxis protein
MATQDQGYTILIADDEPEVVDLVRMVLELDGYTVLIAENGQKTVDRVRAELPDLVLLDVRMPKMSGLAVLEHLGEDEATANIPVIMLSVVTTYPEVQQALREGAVAYLSKPFEIREMSRLVGRVLAMDGKQRDAYRQQALKSIGKMW